MATTPDDPADSAPPDPRSEPIDGPHPSPIARPAPRWPAALPTALLLLITAVLTLSRPADRPRADATPTGYRVDLNTADAAELVLLPGLGPITARRVVAHRLEHGPFATFEQVQDVHGLGEKTVARLVPYAWLGGAEAPVEDGD